MSYTRINNYKRQWTYWQFIIKSIAFSKRKPSRLEVETTTITLGWQKSQPLLVAKSGSLVATPDREGKVTGCWVNRSDGPRDKRGEIPSPLFRTDLTTETYKSPGWTLVLKLVRNIYSRGIHTQNSLYVKNKFVFRTFNRPFCPLSRLGQKDLLLKCLYSKFF